MLKYLENRLGSGGYWLKGIWPPNSCNLNPLDFSIWHQVEMDACSTSHKSRENLMAAVEAAWNNLDKNYIRDTCASFRRQVELMVAAEGGVFEKK